MDKNVYFAINVGDVHQNYEGCLKSNLRYLRKEVKNRAKILKKYI